LEEQRAAVAVRLRERQPEIEQAVMARVQGIASPSESDDPEYLAGLHAVLIAAVDFSLTVVERGEERAPPIPAAFLTQAKMAARNGVELEIVLRRLFAGYGVLGEFVIDESASGAPMGEKVLSRLIRGQAALFDRVVAKVIAEYTSEVDERFSSAEGRRRKRVQRLLAGEVLEAGDLGYDLSSEHLGIAARGSSAGAEVRGLAAQLGCRVLIVEQSDGVVWGWFGGRTCPDPAEVLRLASPPNVCIGVGEPGAELSGWRMTHRQATAALAIAGRREDRMVRYADIALLSSISQDQMLSSSLRRMYLDPLHDDRDGGQMICQTLRAYFASGRQVSSTAAALRVSRQTVAKRLTLVEARLDRPLAKCALELEAALRLEELDEKPSDE
jgi:hypothetical protein